MKIVLAGSPQISVKAFEKVINNFDVVAIITQPDRPKGRGLKMQSTPVSLLAEKYNIETIKVEKIIEAKERLLELNFDLLLTFAYGQYIPTSILSMGKFKPMNIHGSLLPKYRGAAPIHHAILNGDTEMGITLIEMTKEMDAGDMYFKASKEISENTTTSEGFEIISELASENIINWLNKIKDGQVNPIKQGDDFSLSPKIQKSFAELKDDLTIEKAIRKIRGLNSFPGAFILINGKRLKVFDVSKSNIENSIELKFSDGSLFVKDYQWEGKKRINISNN